MQSIAAPAPDDRLARVAGAIAEPARARMLCCLLDGHARTATELAVVAGVAPSTASTHLARLLDQQLVQRVAQGKHRYHRLANADVAAALEALLVVAGVARVPFVPATPEPLRRARTCYDHIAGAAGVALHDHLHAEGWLIDGKNGYDLTPRGAAELANWGVDVAAAQALRRKFACPCMDWSERRPHLGGALGSALLQRMLARGWLVQDLDSRALRVTARGRRALPALA